MCGIAGQARVDGQVPAADLLERMCARIEHRGPDARGVHLTEGAGLGIQRLRVIDLASGDQPIYNEDRSVAVVLNGEIYNYRELRRRLQSRGHSFRTAGDTEVIAHLYEQEGTDFVRSLHGMFAVAVWDANERRLVLARDRLGKKPLFYAERNGVLSFASELAALLEDREISRSVDYGALDAYLALRYVPSPRTAFSQIAKLPPAHTLVFEGGRSQLARYWELDYTPKRTGSDAELVDQLRAHLSEAVRRRLLADVPVGAFLSGGVDSAAVVATMAEQSSGSVKTFSIGFEGEQPDELPAARLLAERFGADHHEFTVTPDASELLPQIVRHHGEPFADATAIPMFYLCRVAREHVTVALCGDGGDEIFGGYTRYIANLALARTAGLPLALRRTLARIAALTPSSARIDSWPSRVRRLGQTLTLAPPARYFSYVSHLSGLRREELYTDAFRDSLDLDRPQQLIEAAWRAPGGAGMLDRMLDTDLHTYLPDDLLTKADIASMASSLELRSPLLDHELVQFAASLPASQKVRGRQKKILLRRALRGRVPDEILDAPKRGFHPPIARWLRGPLGATARELLLDSSSRQRGQLRPERVERLLDRHAQGAEDHSEMIWRLMLYELWHREFIDGSGASAASKQLPATSLAQA
jgi:asparagine synthase (glutamine-hydrolysing)